MENAREVKEIVEKLERMYSEEERIAAEFKNRRDAIREDMAEKLGFYKKDGVPDKSKIKATSLKRAIEIVMDHINKLEEELELVEKVAQELKQSQNEVREYVSIEEELKGIRKDISEMKKRLKELTGDEFLADLLVQRAKTGSVPLPDEEKFMEIKRKIAEVLGS